MKASAIIINGAAQLHLQPENDFEKMVLKHFACIPHPVMVHDNVEFFTTNGGFFRGADGAEARGLSLVRSGPRP